ncbi:MULTISPECIES: hypothetical protein [unclassified Vibrio]|uniref:hypothetical protein n=1 Tax=Vibrio TaxID=662 RepID=UPI0035537269
MKIFKILAASVLSLVLVGCGGHGYEGKYEATITQADLFGGLLGNSRGAKNTETTTMTLGKNYIMFEEDKTELSSIEVVEEDGEKFLKLVNKEDKDDVLWISIEEDPTTLNLSTPLGFISYTKA